MLNSNKNICQRERVERESLFNKLNVKLQVYDFVISPHPHQHHSNFKYIKNRKMKKELAEINMRLYKYYLYKRKNVI